MYYADLVGGIAAWLVGAIPVVWNIRHSDLGPSSNKRTTIWTANVCGKVSGWLPASIICCSEASERVHGELGYSAQKMVVIPNVFDLSRFRLDPTARLEVCSELKLPPEIVLIGLIARFNVQKDHRNFVNAADSLHSCRPDVQFLLCGDGITRKNSELSNWIRDAGMMNSLHFLGRREDIYKIMPSLDIATLSSFCEGFPNVIGEPMATSLENKRPYEYILP
jgi:glycosyltransferase involved in cell wall biosynthesis